MMMVMVVAAAAAIVMMVMAFLTVVMVVTFLTMVMVVAFLTMVMVPAAFPVVVMMVMIKALLTVVMDMTALPHLCQQIIQHGILLLNNFQKLASVKLVQRSGDDDSIGVLLPNHFHILLYLRSIGNVRTAQYDGSRILYLVIEELSEILHVHLAFCRIHNGHSAV